MFHYNHSASPFAPPLEAFADLPPTQKAPLDLTLAALASGQTLCALLLESEDSAEIATQYLLATTTVAHQSALLESPGADESEFLAALSKALQVPQPSPGVDGGGVVPAMVAGVVAKLLAESAITTPIWVVVNKAHQASSAVMRHITALSAASTDGARRLAVVLIGQHGLQKLLPRADVGQSGAGIQTAHTVHTAHLPDLTELDTIDHIARRMALAGFVGPLPFELQALKRIHAATKGLPPRVNALCDQAFVRAGQRNSPQVTAAMVADLLFTPPPASASSSEPGLSSAMQPGPVDVPNAPFKPVVVAQAPSVVTLESTAPEVSAPEDAAVASPPVAPAAAAHVPAADHASVHRSRVSKTRAASTPRPPRPSRPSKLVLGVGAGCAVAVIAFAATLLSGKAEPGSSNLPAPADASANSVDGAPTGEPAANTTPRIEFAASSATAALASLAPEPVPETSASAEATTSTLPDLASISDDTDAAWAALGKRWGLNLKGPNVCATALEQGHQCFRKVDSSLSELQSLNRPGLVQLQQGAVKRWVQLDQWSGDTVTLTSGKQTWKLPSKQFASLWSGRFTTLWRQPMDQPTRLFVAQPEEPAGRWLDRRLQKLQAKGALTASATTPGDRIKAFQKEHGLKGDGKAVPSTFIRVNQLTGVTEPRLLP